MHELNMITLPELLLAVAIYKPFGEKVAERIPQQIPLLGGNGYDTSANDPSSTLIY
jgi:hypothetical protein